MRVSNKIFILRPTKVGCSPLYHTSRGVRGWWLLVAAPLTRNKGGPYQGGLWSNIGPPTTFAPIPALRAAGGQGLVWRLQCMMTNNIGKNREHSRGPWWTRLHSWGRGRHKNGGPPGHKTRRPPTSHPRRSLVSSGAGVQQGPGVDVRSGTIVNTEQ